MDRVLRNYSRAPARNAADSQIHPSQKSSVRNTVSNWKLVEQKRDISSEIQLKTLCAVLEDTGSNLLRIRSRTILGDKTNKSPMSFRNEGNKLHPAPHVGKKKSDNSPHEKKISSNSAESKAVKLPSQPKLTVNKKIAFHKESLLVNAASRDIENHASSSDLSNKCIYTNIQRETIRNQNMPIEEKLAQYEFEFDENEQVMKKKKTKNVKRKRKIRMTDMSYHPTRKIIIEKTQQLPSLRAPQKVEKVPKKVLVEQNLKSDTSKKISDNCNICLDNKKSSTSKCSSYVPQINKKDDRNDSFLENVSPIPQPNNCRTFGRRELKDCGEKISEMEISSCVNITQSNVRCYEETPSRLHCPERIINNKIPVLEEAKAANPSTAENEPLNESYHLTTPVRDKEFTEKLSKVSAGGLSAKTRLCLIRDAVNDFTYSSLEEVKTANHSTAENESLNESYLTSPGGDKVYTEKHSKIITDGSSTKTRLCRIRDAVSQFTSSPEYSPVTRNDKRTENSFHSTNHRPGPLSQKVLFAPRMSGGAASHCNEELGEKWSIENCFGFEDECRETEPLSLLSNISLRQKLGRTIPFSSTPVFSNGKKTDRLSRYFKRKRDTTDDELCSNPPRSAETEINLKNISDTDKLNTSKTETLSPFSNPMKQSKLAFASNNPKTPISEENKQMNRESPLLFKDTDDKTPVHFKEPARRSYIRTIRRKLKPLCGEWIEVNSDEEDHDHDHEHHTSVKKRKKDKISKQEEKEANKWMKEFNMQCGEIEDFQLCVE